MTQEEKARAYDGALEKAKKRVALEPQDHTDAILKDIFPELRESEDEKIRKWLVDYFCSIKETVWIHRDITCGQILSWLEKQKEPEKEELVYRLNGLMQEYIKEAKDQEEEEHRFKCYKLFWDALEDTSYFEQEEQKPELVQQPPITYTYNSNASREERLKAALLALLNSDLLKVKEGGYFTKQDLIEWVERIPTDKPAWSDEDEEMLNRIIETLSLPPIYDTKACAKMVAWLKSLRPSWKPTEEQMEALKEALETYKGFEEYDAMKSLYEQLKKL